MSDAKLRELERRWKETGSVEDEAAYLLERVRVGDLSRERLELAAYCGHEGAVSAVGARRTHIRSAHEWLSWVGGLKRWEPGVALCAFAAAFKRVALPIILADPATRESAFATFATILVERLDDWLTCPTDARRAALRPPTFAECGLPNAEFRFQTLADDPIPHLMGLPGDSIALAEAARTAIVTHVLTRRDST